MAKKLFFILAAGMLVLPAVSSAQIINPFEGTNMDSPIDSVSDGVSLLVTALKWMYTIFFLVAIAYILLAAYAFVTSKGDLTKVKAAQSRLLYAVIAIAVALLSYSIVLLVKDALEKGATG